MSRLIVKNLPAYLDDEKLKIHFGKRANSVITDVKVVRRPDGTSRRFGFVGFRNETEAQDALQYFDRTFIDTSRISVTVAKALQDDDLKAAQERRRAAIRREGKDTSASGRYGDEGGATQKSRSVEEGPSIKEKRKAISFEEFMEVMKPKSKRKGRGNGDSNDADARLDPKIFEEEPQRGTKKAKTTADALTDSTEDTTGLQEEGGEEPATAAGETTAHDEGMTDLEYMYKKMKRKVGTDLDDGEETKRFEQPDEEEALEEEKTVEMAPVSDEEADPAELRRRQRKQRYLEEKARKAQEDVDVIMSSGRLFVRNLPFAAQEEDLESYFSRFGEVSQVHLSLDKTNKKSKGIAFVTFPDAAHALAAFRSTDGHTFQGRILHVLPAVPRGAEAEGKTLKDKKRQSMKADASKDFNWSTLYMSADAVAGSVADRLGIDKTDLLNPHDEESGKSVSPAVRLALAETSVINETRDFLQSEGINVDAFDNQTGKAGSRRSDTIILAKNIPYGTSADVVKALFEKHGAVERVVMPPSGTIAVVEMQVAGEARVAFKALAYKRLGNSVLYLEKAPLGLMSAPKDSAGERRTTEADSIAAKQSVESAAVPQTQGVERGATLFVKNLSFSTTDERLQLAFTKFVDVLFTRIQKRETRKRDGSGTVQLSMGYAFVGFRTLAAATAAQKAMDKSTLDGHVLSVALARRGHDEDTQDVGSADSANEVAPSNKLIVKNLAFEATKKEVRELFAAYGKLKSVRVPRKGLASVGGAATGVRGFGFVEFVSRSEALYAYRALRHSHLLGRHLVLEWDVEGGSTTTSAGLDAGQVGSDKSGDSIALERLRQKAARNVATSTVGSGAHRREKLKLNEEDIRQAAKDERRAKADDDDDDDDDDEE